MENRRTPRYAAIKFLAETIKPPRSVVRIFEVRGHPPHDRACNSTSPAQSPL